MGRVNGVGKGEVFTWRWSAQGVRVAGCHHHHHPLLISSLQPPPWLTSYLRSYRNVPQNRLINTEVGDIGGVLGVTRKKNDLLEGKERLTGLHL